MNVSPLKSVCTLSRCWYSSVSISRRIFVKQKHIARVSNTFEYKYSLRNSSTLNHTRPALATDSKENYVIYEAANYTKGNCFYFHRGLLNVMLAKVSKL